MDIAENLRATHAVGDRVANVKDKVAELIHGTQIVFGLEKGFNTNHSDGKEARKGMEQTANDVDIVKRSSSLNLISTNFKTLHVISGNQLRESIHKWLSPPNPSTNHNIACDTHHKRTATWFFEGSLYQEWKSKGLLLWIHGKRALCPKFTSDTVPSEGLDIVADSGKRTLW